MAPWLSIVMPARNDAAALGRTLDHLLRLPVTHDVSKPILKTAVAYPQMMIAALNTVQKKLARVLRPADRYVIYKNRGPRRTCNDLQG